MKIFTYNFQIQKLFNYPNFFKFFFFTIVPFNPADCYNEPAYILTAATCKRLVCPRNVVTVCNGS